MECVRGKRGEGGGALLAMGGVGKVRLGWVHSVGVVLGGRGWDGCTAWGWCLEGGAGMGAQRGGGAGRAGMGAQYGGSSVFVYVENNKSRETIEIGAPFPKYIHFWSLCTAQEKLL